MKFIEPLREDKKLKYHLDTGEYKRVGIYFWHGVGDCIMFQAVLNKLKKIYPNIQFKMVIPRGLDEEVIFPDAHLISSLEEAKESGKYDLIAQVNMPVETDPNLTKSELCCKLELGIELISDYKQLPIFPNKIVGLHFQITCLPHLANPDEKTAEKIWNEVLKAGWIPIETHFEHVFHNPVNIKFPFIDCSVRRCQPKMENLISLIQICGAFIGVVSGNFHCAMATLPHDRIMFLEKEIPVNRFTHEDIKTVDVKNYKDGIVLEWLKSLENK